MVNIYYMLPIITTSRRQGQYREVVSAGSLSAKLQVDGLKSHRRPGSRGQSAQDNETHRFEEYGECGNCAATAHVLIWGERSEGFLFNVQWRLLMIKDSWATELNVLATWRLSAKHRAKPIAAPQPTLAPDRATGQVIKQKPADGIVSEAIGDELREGLNISQEAARFTSTRGVELGKERWRVLNGHLLEHILAPDNLQTAWKQVKRNKGVAGADAMTLDAYPYWAEQHWAGIRRALTAGYSIPQPAKARGHPQNQWRQTPVGHSHGQ